MTTLYSCKSEIDSEGTEHYRITKFDSDMNVESSYIVSIGKGWAMTCECPAMGRLSCRHRDMLPKFIARGAVNTNWMFDFDRGGWVQMEWEGEINSVAIESAGASSLYGIGPAIHEIDMTMRNIPSTESSTIEPVELRRASSPEPIPTPNPSPILRRF